MRIFARTMTKSSFIDTEIFQDLGVLIEHKGRKYSLSPNREGDLVIRSLGSTQLVIIPESSNAVKIEARE